MTFQNPVLFLLIPLVITAAFIAKKRERLPSVRFSSGRFLTVFKPTLKTIVSKNMIILRVVAIVLMIFALARPQSPIEESRVETEGVDIILAIDTSTSMLAEDFKIDRERTNRLEAVKDVVKEFIDGRANDRIGIIAFAARAYMVSPLTLDYDWLLQNLERVEIGMIEDGTAIGSGISSAVNRLRETKAKSKLVILLTDGRNNAGRISPSLSAETAKALGIKVYTIGAGTKGLAPYPAKDFFGNLVYKPVKVEIDEDTLIKVASETGGRYFRATDTKSLREIYKEIDEMETTTIEEQGYMEYKELFHLFLYPGLFLLLSEIVLSNTLLRRIP